MQPLICWLSVVKYVMMRIPATLPRQEKLLPLTSTALSNKLSWLHLFPVCLVLLAFKKHFSALPKTRGGRGSSVTVI